MVNSDAYHFCAIDGGGTACRAMIADREGTVLAQGSGGPANFATDPAQAIASVLSATQAAAVQLGLDETEVSRLVSHVGLAGIMDDFDANTLKAGLPFKVCSVSDDRETSAIGALGAADGAILAIGTGSFVAVRQGGAIRFFGGYGLNVGDQASGAWLGRMVLESTLMVCDGLEGESDLTRKILSQFNGRPADIVSFAATAKPSEYAGFAPGIIDAATNGDSVGRALMARGADYLNATLAASGVAKDQVICLIGGVGPHYAPYLDQKYRTLVRPANGTALDGAMYLARKWLEKLETST